MVKICGNSVVAPLSMIFKDCLANGTYPSKRKKSHVCSVHKKYSKNVVKKYRPIFILPCLTKYLKKYSMMHYTTISILIKS